MKRIIKKVTGITIFTLLFPFLFTLIFTGKTDAGIYTIEKSGKYIIVSGNGYEQELDVEEFIPCVLMSEMSIDASKEALKAQTVIIRTYIYKYMENKNEVTAEETGLDYIKYSELKKLWGKEFYVNYNKLNGVTGETSLEVITHNGELIQPFFHYISAGKTRDGAEVFSDEKYAYLQSVDSKADSLTEGYLDVKYYKSEDFFEKLGIGNETESMPEDGKITDLIEITEKCSAGYVLKLVVCEEEYTGDEFQDIFDLNSSCFYFEDAGKGVNIVTKGQGHGFGISIEGAVNMAEEGSTYDEILKYYFADIEIKKE